MNAKISKLLFEFTRNSRISTKELGKRIKSTQQSSSYLLKQLKKNKLLKQPVAIVDNAKLGFINVLVGMNYLEFDHDTKKKIIDELKSNDPVINIESANHGVDLLIEFSSENLSAFNKSHTELLQKFQKSLETVFVFPVIVKHIYMKNYLSRKFDYSDIIISGDRETRPLSDNELSVLHSIAENPDSTLVSIAKKSGLSVKSAVAIKKSLENDHIIQNYSYSLDNKSLGIHRYLLFLKFSGGDIKEKDSLVKYAKMNSNIVSLTKVIGEYNILLCIEEINQTNLINSLRSRFPIKKYLVVESENIVKNTCLSPSK